mgnify:CR=1 FL=1
MLQFIFKQKHIVNITINEKDCKAILENSQYKESLKYVHGIGISLVNLYSSFVISLVYKELINFGRYVL